MPENTSRQDPSFWRLIENLIGEIMPKPKLDERIVLREEGDEAFLFNPDTAAIKTLNDTGVFIWKLCDGAHSKDDIVKKVIESYDVKSKDVAQKDAEEFLKALEKSKFISYE